MRTNPLSRAGVAVTAGFISAACPAPAPPNSAGVSGYEVILTESPLASTTVRQVQSVCPTGKKALGAGWGVVDSTNAILDGTATYFEPAYDGSGWLTNARKNSTFTPMWKLQVRMICATVAP
jgi:hypothetical protein